MKRSAAWLLVLAAGVGAALFYAVGPAGWGWPEWNSAIGVARRERVVAGFVVGAGLSVAGALMQALLRNPLADPYVLGVSGGAALGAAVAIVLGLSGAAALPAAAFAGGLLSLALAYGAAARRRQAPSIYAVLLSGVIVSSICGALLMALISLAPTIGLRGITWWMLGSLQAPSSPLLRTATAVTGAALVAAWALAKEWNALTFGAQTAHTVGVRAQAAVLAGLALATLMAASAVALAGLIGFVGLIVPHAARAIVGADHRRLLPTAALAGGLLLAACDTLARTAHPAAEIPVGIITALFGGPFFLYLLRRRRGWCE